VPIKHYENKKKTINNSFAIMNHKRRKTCTANKLERYKRNLNKSNIEEDIPQPHASCCNKPKSLGCAEN
jgi:hypothetical protein